MGGRVLGEQPSSQPQPVEDQGGVEETTINTEPGMRKADVKTKVYMSKSIFYSLTDLDTSLQSMPVSAVDFLKQYCWTKLAVG